MPPASSRCVRATRSPARSNASRSIWSGACRSRRSPRRASACRRCALAELGAVRARTGRRSGRGRWCRAFATPRELERLLGILDERLGIDHAQLAEAAVAQHDEEVRLARDRGRTDEVAERLGQLLLALAVGD